jgi:hypothetical protein
MAANGHANGADRAPGFLSFNSLPPRLHITSEDDEFDEVTIQHWREEGFDVTYLPMGEGGKAYRDAIKDLPNDLELGETFGIVAYGDAATICLDIATKPIPHCCALICYYPSEIPHPTAKYPTQLNLVVHLTASQGFAPKFKYFKYPNVEPGFAEHDLPEYNRVSAGLAWSRTLKAVRKGFKQDVDIETVREKYLAFSLGTKDAAATIGTMVQQPYVNHIPTGTGGIGKRALYHFYKDFFGPGSPPSLTTRLVSRTAGVDRVIDEFVLSFKHTQEVPWMLPGVPPTNRQVNVPVVSVVAVRGQRLVHEHVYWDQASVLVQIGALDPKNVPNALKSKGCKRLPVMGPDEAKKVLDVESVPSNQFIDKW